MSDELPGWTCPAIDRVAAIVRRWVPEVDRSEALISLEELRVAHVRLRAIASGRDGGAKVQVEIDRLERSLDSLIEHRHRVLEGTADPETAPERAAATYPPPEPGPPESA